MRSLNGVIDRMLAMFVPSAQTFHLCPSRSPFRMRTSASARRLCPSHSLPLAPGHFICERALSLALPVGGRATPPNPLQVMLAARTRYRLMPPLCQIAYAYDPALGTTGACAHDIPLHIRIESGIQGTKSLAGDARGAAAPCRPPRRRTASRLAPSTARRAGELRGGRATVDARYDCCWNICTRL
jgi:hypothetical protein